MQLKFLGDLDVAYTRMEYVDYGAGGQYVGVLAGSLKGERLSGDVFLVNTPPKRPDSGQAVALGAGALPRFSLARSLCGVGLRDTPVPGTYLSPDE